jgi:hypothetical protein
MPVKIVVGAIRADNLKVYYYNTATGKETLTLDFELLSNTILKRLVKGSTTLLEAYTEVAKVAKKEIKAGATKALALSLANLIFIFR